MSGKNRVNAQIPSKCANTLYMRKTHTVCQSWQQYSILQRVCVFQFNSTNNSSLIITEASTQNKHKQLLSKSFYTLLWPAQTLLQSFMSYLASPISMQMKLSAMLPRYESALMKKPTPAPLHMTILTTTVALVPSSL